MRIAGLAAAAVTLSLGVAGLPGQAWADEAPTTAAEANKVVEKLKAEQAELDKKYDEINTRATELGDRVDAQRAQLDAADKKVAAMKSQLGAVARASYQGHGTDTTIGLLTSADANNFLTRVGTIDQVTANQTVTLQQFQTEQANLTDLQRSLSADEAKVKTQLDELKKVDEAARAKVEQAQQVADRLSAEEKAKFEAEQRAKEAAAAEQRATQQAQGVRVASTAQERMAAPNAAAATAAAPAAAEAAPAGGYAAPAVVNAAGNTYSWGQCTWWAYARRSAMGRPVASNWGNAGAWAANARAAGFAVDYTPEVGAVLVQFNAPVGHVAVVESVNGGMISISEMNWNGGVGVVHYRTLAAAGAGMFIH